MELPRLTQHGVASACMTALLPKEFQNGPALGRSDTLTPTASPQKDSPAQFGMWIGACLCFSGNLVCFYAEPVFFTQDPMAAVPVIDA